MPNQPRKPARGTARTTQNAQKTRPQNQQPAASSDSANRPQGNRNNARRRYEKNRREMQIIRIVATVIIITLIGAAGWGIWSWASNKSDNASPGKTVANYTYTGNNHTYDAVTYAEVPPVGGPHNPVWQNCGYYPAPINNENAVHSLEHGAVWITYQPDLPQDQIDRLREIAEGQDYILVSPYPGLDVPVVASSWNHQIRLDGADDPDLMRFIKNYKQGPDTPEPGASCSSGTSAVAT